MSDVPQQTSLRHQLSGRWQIPLLVASLGLLAAGIWRMRPEPVPPTFEQLFEYAVALKEAELYPEASEYIEQIEKTGKLSDELEKSLTEAISAFKTIYKFSHGK